MADEVEREDTVAEQYEKVRRCVSLRHFVRVLVCVRAGWRPRPPCP
jgi:hypothetical protein